MEPFQDSTGSDIGDFQGLIARLDYLAGLGVIALWLLPFYPSPNRDNGYDVMDCYGCRWLRLDEGGAARRGAGHKTQPSN